MDINVTEAALWTEDEFNTIVAYLESARLTVFVEQARSFREKGMDGYDEWQRIEAEAANLPPEELVRVGKGPHLLPENKGKAAERPTPASPASTAPQQKSQGASE